MTDKTKSVSDEQRGGGQTPTFPCPCPARSSGRTVPGGKTIAPPPGTIFLSADEEAPK